MAVLQRDSEPHSIGPWNWALGE